MPQENKQLYEFGDFRLDIKEKILLRGDEQIALTPKVFETLCLFVENAGRLIEKSELMEKLWGDSFVEESNLTFNIRQLRIALNDNIQNPTFIKTVPRHGYRFIAEVREAAEQPEKISDEEKSAIIKNAQFESPQVFLKSAYFITALILLLVISIVGATAILWTRITTNSKIPILSRDFRSKKLTTTGGVFNAVISPNGRRMAYTSVVAGKQSLWIRNLETSENVEIFPSSENFYGGVAFSNDGENIYFTRGERDKGLALLQVSAMGGIPKEIVKSAQGWLSVSPDNRKISFVRCFYQNDDYCSLYIVDTNGKNEQKLLTRPTPIRMADNQFSPDGSSVVVALGQSRSGSQDFGLLEVDIKTKAEREVTKRKFFNIKYLRWLSNNNELLFSAIEQFSTISKLYQVSLDTGEVKSLTNDSLYYNQISLDNAFEKMVTTQVISDFRLWVTPINDIKSAHAISFANGGFEFSPKGKIYYAQTTERTQIWSMNPDGSEPRQLTNSEGVNWRPLISTDERFVYFVSNRSGSNQVWRMDVDGSNQIQISNGEGGTPFFVTPNDNSVYYVSAINANLAKLTTDSQGNFVSNVVVNERVFGANINPTGDTIAYLSRQDPNKYEIKLITAGDAKPLKTLALVDENFGSWKICWSKDSKYLYYQTHRDHKSTLWKLSIETGKSEKFADLGEEDVTDFSFTDDEKTLGFIRGSWKHDAFLIEGLK